MAVNAHHEILKQRLRDQCRTRMKHYCAKPLGFNDWRSNIVVENK